MNTFFCCPKCGEELEVRTTAPAGRHVYIGNHIFGEKGVPCGNCGVPHERGKEHYATGLGVCEITSQPTDTTAIPIEMSKEFNEWKVAFLSMTTPTMNRLFGTGQMAKPITLQQAIKTVMRVFPGTTFEGQKQVTPDKKRRPKKTA